MERQVKAFIHLPRLRLADVMAPRLKQRILVTVFHRDKAIAEPYWIICQIFDVV